MNYVEFELRQFCGGIHKHETCSRLTGAIFITISEDNNTGG